MMRAFFLFAPLLPLVGCAAPADSGYPSLLPRPIEQRGFETPAPPPPPALTVADPMLDAEVARLRQSLEAAQTAFGARADEAERLASRATDAAPGSESWIAAQLVLAELDTLRGATAAVLADVERAAIDRAVAGKQPYGALETLLADARAQNQAELERIERIDGMMRAA
ncbi:hypothetical protein [Sphingomonas sp. IW22]|uniref:hypothetical protein n=1 Tax=Sphingomonas sp. IW22 TaxID=3242489 RepID=UPI0035213D6B